MEVMVAMAILVLLVAAFAPMVSQSFVALFGAGRKSQAIQQAEAEVSHAVQSETNWDDKVHLDFGDGVTVDVSGQVLSIELHFEDKQASLTVFTPAR